MIKKIDKQIVTELILNWILWIYTFVYVQKHQIDKLDLIPFQLNITQQVIFQIIFLIFFSSACSICQIHMKYKSNTKPIEILGYLWELALFIFHSFKHLQLENKKSSLFFIPNKLTLKNGGSITSVAFKIRCQPVISFF